jgi:hypothetical protein
LSELKKKFIEQYVKINIDKQKKAIDNKVKKVYCFELYQEKVLKKLLKKHTDSVKKGADLVQFFEQLETKKKNKQFAKYVKYQFREEKKQIDKSVYFRATIDLEQCDRAKDFYAVVLTARNFSNKLGYSHTHINNWLNDIGFETQKFKIEYHQQVSRKKIFKEQNFFRFKKKYFYGSFF